MKKNKVIVAISIFSLLLANVFLGTPKSFAEDAIPTIYGWSYDYIPLDFNPMLWVGLSNPMINEAEVIADPENVSPAGVSICHVETDLTFPKDIMEITAINSSGSVTSNYSNEDGTLHVEYGSCSTETWIDLFDVTFTAKAVGTGTIHFLSYEVLGGEGGTTPITSGVYSDIAIEIVPVQENQPAPQVKQTLPTTIVPSIPPSTTSSSKTTGKSSGVNTSLVKIIAKPESSAFKTPTLTKLEFGPTAVLDKPNSRSKGAVFTGTGEPNSKMFLLINSQNEIYTDTTSDANGAWTKTVDEWLEDGSHTVAIWSEKDNKISKKFSSNFVISSYAKDQIAIGDTYPESSAKKIATTTTPKKTGAIDALFKSKFFWIYLGAGIIILVLIVILIVRSRRRKKIDPVEDILSGRTGSSVPNNQPSAPPETPTFQAPPVQTPQPQNVVTPNPTPQTPTDQNSIRTNGLRLDV